MARGAVGFKFRPTCGGIRFRFPVEGCPRQSFSPDAIWYINRSLQRGLSSLQAWSALTISTPRISNKGVVLQMEINEGCARRVRYALQRFNIITGGVTLSRVRC